ncbi:MAG: PaaI family thioesterase [Alphaproteobacteria bacterium]
MTDQTLIERLWEIGPKFVQGAPHSKLMGMTFVSVDIGRATLSLPYNSKLIGNPKTRVLHGGAITTMLDQASGLASMASFEALHSVATLNLSIDYMRAARPGETVIVSAHCHKVTRHVAFVRGVAHDGDEDDPIAMSQATFMATGAPITSLTPQVSIESAS